MELQSFIRKTSNRNRVDRITTDMQADLEQRSAHIALAQRQLTTLERMARDKGFGLIARKAASLRS